MVPSVAVTGSEAISSGITALFQAACNRRPRPSADIRSRRDRPEPFSSTSSGSAGPRASSQARIAASASSAPAGRLPALQPQGQEQLARHDIVGELVDVAHHFGKSRRWQYGDRRASAGTGRRARRRPSCRRVRPRAGGTRQARRTDAPSRRCSSAARRRRRETLPVSTRRVVGPWLKTSARRRSFQSPQPLPLPSVILLIIEVGRRRLGGRRSGSSAAGSGISCRVTALKFSSRASGATL
jgi:hypothetical protein